MNELKDVSLWQWTALNNGWVQDGRGYRAAGVWCGVWDLHGREWQAEVVAKRIAGYHLRWKWQCRPIDDACLPDRDGDQIQIVMLRDSVTIDCSGTRWNTSFPIAPSEALINCQAILMAMGFANSRPRNPIPLVSPRELLEMQGLRP